MPEIRYTAEFQASRDAIWPWLEEPEKIQLWMQGVVDDRPTSAPPTRVGSTFEMDIKEGRKITTYAGVITAFDKPAHMGVRLTGGCGKQPMTMDVDYLIRDLGGGRSRIDYRCQMLTPNKLLFKLMTPLMKLFGRMMIRKFMRNLRAHVEAAATAAS